MTRIDAILRDLTVRLRAMPELEARDLSGLDIRIRFDPGEREPSKVIVRPERSWAARRRRRAVGQDGSPRDSRRV